MRRALLTLVSSCPSRRRGTPPPTVPVTPEASIRDQIMKALVSISGAHNMTQAQISSGLSRGNHKRGARISNGELLKFDWPRHELCDGGSS